MTRKLFTLIFALLLGLTACSGGNATLTGSGAGLVPASTDTDVPLPASSDTPTLPPPTSRLTLEVLKNFTYYAPFYGRTVTLVDGKYSEGADANAYYVWLLDKYAIGDLNGDGINDAAVFLVENGGGTGSFVSVAVVLDQGGQPAQAGALVLGDQSRVQTMVNAVSISDSRISVDETVGAPNDPACCPSQPMTQTYQLIGSTLTLTRVVTLTLDGSPRAINIESPLFGAEVTNPVTVTGSVTIAPFENNLVYRIYNADGELINESSLMVDAPDMGAPGTFELTFNLENAGVTGLIRVEFWDLSAADGSPLAMDSVMLLLH